MNTRGTAAPLKKDSTTAKSLFFIMQIPAFNSSAVESIATADGNVVITFKGGRDYTYGVADLEKFLTELTSTVNAQGSVGRFVNNAIRSEVLTAVAA